MTDENNSQLPDFSPEELRNIKSQYNKAKDILEKISALQVKFEATQATLTPKQIDIRLEKISSLMLAGLAIQLCKDGLTYDDICETLHISKSDVTKMLSGYQKARKAKTN